MNIISDAISKDEIERMVKSAFDEAFKDVVREREPLAIALRFAEAKYDILRSIDNA